MSEKKTFYWFTNIQDGMTCPVSDESHKFLPYETEDTSHEHRAITKKTKVTKVFCCFCGSIFHLPTPESPHE